MRNFRNILKHSIPVLFSLQPQTSFMSFEGQQVQGSAKILEKFQVSPVKLNQINSYN